MSSTAPEPSTGQSPHFDDMLLEPVEPSAPLAPGDLSSED